MASGVRFVSALMGNLGAEGSIAHARAAVAEELDELGATHDQGASD
jgi:hypothetical protein